MNGYPSENKTAVAAFMLGLEELTRRTGIAVGGCGCCGSPYLVDAEQHTEANSRYIYDADDSNEVEWAKADRVKQRG